MNQALAKVEPTTRDLESIDSSAHECALPSGRSVILLATSAGEELQVRSPTGAVEVRITFSDSGPVLQLSGARLELQALDTVAIQCRQLEINTEESLQLKSAGNVQLSGQEMRVKTTGDMHLNGKVIRLNCPS